MLIHCKARVLEDFGNVYVVVIVLHIFKPLLHLLQLVIDDLRTTAFDVCEAAIKDIFEIEYMVIIPDKLFFKMEAKGKPGNICLTAHLCNTSAF